VGESHWGGVLRVITQSSPYSNFYSVLLFPLLFCIYFYPINSSSHNSRYVVRNSFISDSLYVRARIRGYRPYLSIDNQKEGRAALSFPCKKNPILGMFHAKK
jgi:hypothetical protein